MKKNLMCASEECVRLRENYTRLSVRRKKEKKKLARVLKCERIRFKGERERERKLDLNATD